MEIKCKNLGELMKALMTLSEKFGLDKEIKVKVLYDLGICAEGIIVSVDRERIIWFE